MLPAATSLKKQGANKGATTAFLISTPESGVDSIAITYALLDPVMTVIRPIAAFFSAMCAGFLENTLHWDKDGGTGKKDISCPIDQCCDGNDCPPEDHYHHHTLLEKIKAGLKFAVNDVWGDIVLWFFVGLLLAGIISAMIPNEMFETWLGGGFSSMLVMLFVGIPIYICATASTPIAAALILKGVSPGAALVFLLVGPATNVTSLSVLVGILGKMSTIRYLLVLSIGAVCFGLGVDKLYSLFQISPRAIIGDAADIIPYGLKLFTTLFLLGLSIKPIYCWGKGKFGTPKAATVFVSDFPVITKKTTTVIKPPVSHKCDCS